MKQAHGQALQALVTGANRGIGLEYVRQLLARGDRVVAACREPGHAGELNRLAGEHPGHLHVVPLSLPDPRSIAALVHEIAGLGVALDLVINNAGMLVEGERFGAVTREALDQSFSVNAAGPFLLTQALAPQLADGATVVNMSSGLGSIAGTASFHTPSYAISKAALDMATRLLAHALAERGAIVVALSPGWVRTDMGGAGANLTPGESVADLLRVIGALRARDTGCFFGHDGEALPW
jgi:NAD(P)-dependent dehydrogenase (short-subunit alcohol dehydrogenase family)